MELGSLAIMYGLAAVLLTAGLVLLGRGVNPFRPRRDGARGDIDRRNARVDGIICITAAAGLVVSSLTDNNQLATGIVLIAGFALAYVLGKLRVL